MAVGVGENPQEPIERIFRRAVEVQVGEPGNLPLSDGGFGCGCGVFHVFGLEELMASIYESGETGGLCRCGARFFLKMADSFEILPVRLRGSPVGRVNRVYERDLPIHGKGAPERLWSGGDHLRCGGDTVGRKSRNRQPVRPSLVQLCAIGLRPDTDNLVRKVAFWTGFLRCRLRCALIRCELHYTSPRRDTNCRARR